MAREIGFEIPEPLVAIGTVPRSAVDDLREKRKLIWPERSELGVRMKISTGSLPHALKAIDVGPGTVSIGKVEEWRWCIVQRESGRWAVFYRKDGEDIDVTVHDYEHEACYDLLGRMTLLQSRRGRISVEY